jgi:hypothetical protein
MPPNGFDPFDKLGKHNVLASAVLDVLGRNKSVVNLSQGQWPIRLKILRDLQHLSRPFFLE